MGKIVGGTIGFFACFGTMIAPIVGILWYKGLWIFAGKQAASAGVRKGISKIGAWHCMRCKTENRRKVNYCSQCGTARGWQ
jgi:hypothetical protein